MKMRKLTQIRYSGGYFDLSILIGSKFLFDETKVHRIFVIFLNKMGIWENYLPIFYYWTIIEDGEGNLVIKGPTMADTKIIPERENAFLIKREEYAVLENPTTGWMRFHTDSSGAVTHLTVSHPRLMHPRFDKLN